MTMRLGTNLLAYQYFDTSSPCVLNVAKCSKEWSGGDYNAFTGTLDSDGYISALGTGGSATAIRTFLLNLPTENRFFAGDYILRYDGVGTLQFGDDASIIVYPTLQPEGYYEGVVRISATNSGSCFMKLTATNASPNHLRNIRLCPPGGIQTNNPLVHVTDTGLTNYKSHIDCWDDGTNYFRPEFLAELAAYNSDVGIRFYDWCFITGGNQGIWATRPLMTHASWGIGGPEGGQGIPFELMCALANTMQMNAWFCTPLVANDTYITNMFALINSLLDPSLIPSVEYSNELWNPSFGGQYFYLNQQAANLGLANNLEYGAYRSMQIFALARAQCPRVRRVQGAQSGSAGSVDWTFGYNNSWQVTDAMCIAPYFGDECMLEHTMAEKLTWDLDDLFLQLNTTDIPSAIDQVRRTREAMDDYNPAIPLIGYEGGIDVHPLNNDIVDGSLNEFWNAQIINLYNSAQSDSRMGDCYTDWLTGLEAEGMAEIYHYGHVGQWTRYGYWGAENYINDTANRPKYDALVAWAAVTGPPAPLYENPAQLCADRYASFVANGKAP